MNAKEKQAEVIKNYLKPTLKANGYQTSVQTWWKDKGDFFTLINLQNFSWNTKDDITFCFNIGIVLKATMKDISKRKPTLFDLTVMFRDGAYLPSDRKTIKFRNNTGYLLTNKTNLADFISELKLNVEEYILPDLGALSTIEDCLNRFGSTPFWGSN